MYIDEGLVPKGWYDQQGEFHYYDAEAQMKGLAQVEEKKGPSGPVIGAAAVFGGLLVAWFIWFQMAHPPKRRR